MSYAGVISNSGGGGGVVNSVVGTNGVSATTVAGAVKVSGVNATTSSVGVASFNPTDFTVNGSGEVTLTGFTNLPYTAITSANSPYTVLPTDLFISCDTTGGDITILLPNSTSVGREIVVKDRTGDAAANNLTITTVGGAVTIDGMTSLVFTDNFESVDLMFGSSVYQSF